MKKNIKTAVVLLIVGFLGLLVIKKIESKKETQTQQPPQKPTPSVKVIKPNMEEVTVFYTANGILQAKVSATLKPQVSGRVLKLLVEEGQFVKAGQTLALIEPEKQDYQIESQLALINQLENTYQNKKAIYERRKSLYEKELISKEEFENAKTDMEVALNQLNQAKATLKEYSRQKKETIIKAPFDGYIGKRMINIGDYVDSTTQMFYLLKLNPMWVVFQLPQQYIRNIKEGQTVETDIEGLETKQAKIEFISPSLTENNLFQIKAVVDNSDGRLKENMYAKVKIAVETKRGYKLPEEAIQLMGNDSFIFVVRNGKAVKIPVKILDQQFGHVHITAELKPEDKVIISNIINIKEGLPVKVSQEQEVK